MPFSCHEPLCLDPDEVCPRISKHRINGQFSMNMPTFTWNYLQLLLKSVDPRPMRPRKRFLLLLHDVAFSAAMHHAQLSLSLFRPVNHSKLADDVRARQSVPRRLLTTPRIKPDVAKRNKVLVNYKNIHWYTSLYHPNFTIKVFLHRGGKVTPQHHSGENFDNFLHEGFGAELHADCQHTAQ